MRTTISRIISPIVAAIVAWLTARGLELDPGFATALTEAGIYLVLAVFAAVYGVLHKIIDRYVNPTDSAA